MKKISIVICIIFLLVSCVCLKIFNREYTSTEEFYISSASFNSETNSNIPKNLNDFPNVLDILKSDNFTNEFYDYLAENCDVDISLEKLSKALFFFVEEGSICITAEITTDSQDKSDKIMKALLEFTPKYLEPKLPGNKVFT